MAKNQHHPPAASIKPTDEELKKIIQTDAAAELLVQRADTIGYALAKKYQLTTNQIRAIFGEVRRIEGKWQGNDKEKSLARRQLILLKPKMAYRAQKERRNRGVQELVDILSPAIEYVKGSEENFNRFVDFFEAILAYHKSYGGS